MTPKWQQKMPTILHCISWRKEMEFWFKLHWNLSIWQYASIIYTWTWTNYGLYMCHQASSSYLELYQHRLAHSDPVALYSYIRVNIGSRNGTKPLPDQGWLNHRGHFKNTTTSPRDLWVKRITLQWRHNGRNGSQITSLTIVYATIYSGTDQRTHQSPTSLAFVRGIPRWIPRTKAQ